MGAFRVPRWCRAEAKRVDETIKTQCIERGFGEEMRRGNGTSTVRTGGRKSGDADAEDAKGEGCVNYIN